MGKWYFMAYPYNPKEITKYTDYLLGNFRYFTEVETRLWWATLQQHELFHFLFSLYPEFHLEDEGHQWFDHSKWPADFQGLYEKDYFHEALYKRLLLADIPPYEKILKTHKMTKTQVQDEEGNLYKIIFEQICH